MAQKYTFVTPGDEITMRWDTSPYAVSVDSGAAIPLANTSTVSIAPDDMELTDIHVSGNFIYFTKMANTGTTGITYTLSFHAEGVEGSVWDKRQAGLPCKATG
jgi:hypothetical protein